MKKFTIAALTMTFVVSFSGITAYAKEGTVTASALNVRSQPTTDSSVLGLLPYGSSIELHEQVGSWYKIDFMDQVAYIFGDYVDVSEKDAQEQQQEQTESMAAKLIENAKKYIAKVEDLIGAPIGIISVGPDREQTIFV